MKQGDDWEGYVAAPPGWTVPEGSRFDEAHTTSGVECAFGGPDEPGARYGWGAPFRRLTQRRAITLVVYTLYHPAKTKES